MTAHLVRVRTRLALHAHRRVRGLLEGEYASVQTGRSMDFNDLRAYVRGDDVKDLDWKATARTGELLVRRYAGVRKHTVLLLISTGRSMAAMNDLDVPKRRLAATVAGMVGHLAVRHGDRVGLVRGDASGCHGLPVASGELHLERCLAAAYDATLPHGPRGDLRGLLEHTSRSVRRRTIALLVCDERALGGEEERLLRRLSVQHELLVVTVGDLDPTQPPVGRTLHDVDTGRDVPDWVAAHPVLAGEHAALVAEETTTMRRALDRLGVVHERVHDEDGAVGAVFRLLERQRRARRR